MKKVLKYEDLLKIEDFLREEGLDSDNLSIIMNIDTQERLNRINSDYFFRANPDSKDKPTGNFNNVNIKIGNVNFTYRLRELE